MDYKHITPVSWWDKPYYSLDAYCKNTFGEKIFKIALDGGMTCPNRDGTLGYGGCIFCSANGSGDFAAPRKVSMKEQLEDGRQMFGKKKTGTRFIAYFQSFTNTYAPCEYLKKIFCEALETDYIVGISIATRPDCLGDDVLALLSELKQSYPEKFIWIELGLQTIHEKTAQLIRRGYPLAIFEQAVASLASHDIPCIAHVIYGLPNETPDEMLAIIPYLNALPIWGIKLQLLHVLKDTDLAVSYQQNQFEALSKQAYLNLIIESLEQLRPDMVIHRLTGDGSKDLLLAPLWSIDKRVVLNDIHKQMKCHNNRQGKHYHLPTL